MGCNASQEMTPVSQHDNDATGMGPQAHSGYTTHGNESSESKHGDAISKPVSNNETPNFSDIYVREDASFAKDIQKLVLAIKNNRTMMSFLQGHSMHDRNLHRLANAFKTMTVYSHEELCQVRAVSHYVYILESGHVIEKYTHNDESEEVISYTQPAMFGEGDFLSQTDRTSSFTALDTSIVHYLSYEKFMSIVNSFHVKQSLADFPLFYSLLSNDEISDISKHVQKLTFNSGDLLFRKGDQARMFYIIAKGNVRLYDEESSNESSPISDDNRNESNETLSSSAISTASATYIDVNKALTVDNYIGEESIVTGAPYPVNAVAMDDVEVFAIEKVIFEFKLSAVHKALANRVRKHVLKVKTEIEKEEKARLAKSPGKFSLFHKTAVNASKVVEQ